MPPAWECTNCAPTMGMVFAVAVSTTKSAPASTLPSCHGELYPTRYRILAENPRTDSAAFLPKSDPEPHMLCV